jgi:hypothetical protein
MRQLDGWNASQLMQPFQEFGLVVCTGISGGIKQDVVDEDVLVNGHVHESWESLEEDFQGLCGAL